MIIKTVLNKNQAQGLLLFFYVLAACFFVYYFRPIYLASILIVLAPPALINFFWLKKTKNKVLIFSLLSAPLFALPLELASRLANSWDVQSILPRFLEIAPLENLLFAFLNFFWGISFYEYFINHERNKQISQRFKYLIILFIIFSVIIYSLYFLNPALISLDYYLVAIIVLLIPLTTFLIRKPKLIKKVVWPTLFFALIFFVYETVSLQIGSWWWPGNYLWPVNYLGHVFPIDDVVIWYLLSTPALIAGYDFFVDNG